MAKRPAARPAPKPAARKPAARRRPQAPRPGQNVSAPAIAAEGRGQAAENIAFLGQNLPQATSGFVNAQQGQIDEQARRLDNPFLAQAQGIVRDQLGRTYGSPELEAQMRTNAASAMSYRPDQVTAPTNVRELNPAMAQAAQAQFIGGPQAANMAAAGAQLIGGPQAANMSAAGAQFIGGPQAVMARTVQNIGVRNVGAGALGSSMMARAMEGVQRGGMLGAEASRDAVQAARQGMAARGMATGSAGLAAELLNRDRYRNAREQQDLAFAGSVQAADTQRRFQNAANQLAASQSNQDVATRLSLADQAAANQMGLAGYEGSIQQAQAQAAREQAANAANQAAANQMGLAGYEGSIQQAQAQAAREQAANAANQAAANQMSQLGYQGSIEQAQAQAQREQAANLANQASSNQIGLANQQRDVALGQMSMDAQRLNQAANMEATNMNRAYLGQTANQLINNDMARGQYQLGLGDAMLAYDPYRQAMSPGMQMGQFAGGAAGNAILGQLGGMIDLSGNAATFNTNRQDSLYNSYRNNQAAMRSAAMQAGANNQSGMFGMAGGIGGGLLMGAGLAI